MEADNSGKGSNKKNIWFKKEIGEYDKEKCHLIKKKLLSKLSWAPRKFVCCCMWIHTYKLYVHVSASCRGGGWRG
jgi:hypothetical protein